MVSWYMKISVQSGTKWNEHEKSITRHWNSVIIWWVLNTFLRKSNLTDEPSHHFHIHWTVLTLTAFYIWLARWWPEPYCTKAFISFGSSSKSQSKRKKRKLHWQQKTKASLQSLWVCFLQEKIKAFSSEDSLKFLFCWNYMLSLH